MYAWERERETLRTLFRTDGRTDGRTDRTSGRTDGRTDGTRAHEAIVRFEIRRVQRSNGSNPILLEATTGAPAGRDSRVTSVYAAVHCISIQRLGSVVVPLKWTPVIVSENLYPGVFLASELQAPRLYRKLSSYTAKDSLTCNFLSRLSIIILYVHIFLRNVYRIFFISSLL
jgi:hypothetical protein